MPRYFSDGKQVWEVPDTAQDLAYAQQNGLQEVEAEQQDSSFMGRVGAGVEAQLRGIGQLGLMVGQGLPSAVGALVGGATPLEASQEVFSRPAETMEKVPRVFQDTQAMEGMMGELLFEKPIEYAGKAGAFQATLPGLKQAYEFAGIDPEAFGRTVGERGMEGLLYATGIASFRPGRPGAPKEVKKAGPTIEQLEALKQKADAADALAKEQLKAELGKPLEYQAEPGGQVLTTDRPNLGAPTEGPGAFWGKDTSNLALESLWEQDARLARPAETPEGAIRNQEGRVVSPEEQASRVTRLDEDTLRSRIDEQTLGLERDRPPEPYWYELQKTKTGEEYMYEPYFQGELASIEKTQSGVRSVPWWQNEALNKTIQRTWGPKGMKAITEAAKDRWGDIGKTIVDNIIAAGAAALLDQTFVPLLPRGVPRGVYSKVADDALSADNAKRMMTIVTEFSNKLRKIDSSAARNVKTGEVIKWALGHETAEIYAKADRADWQLGFVDTKGDFLSRNEALMAAGARTSEGLATLKMFADDAKNEARGMTLEKPRDLATIEKFGETSVPKGETPTTMQRTQEARIEELMRSEVGVGRQEQRMPDAVPPKMNAKALERLKRVIAAGLSPENQWAVPKKPKSEFEIWKDALPEAYKPHAKRMWEQLEREKLDNMATKMKVDSGLEGRWVENEKSWKEMEKVVEETQPKDINSSALGRMFQAGKKMAATSWDNPLAKWVVDKIDRMQINIRNQIRANLQDGETGLFPKIKALNKTEKQAWFDWVLSGSRAERWFTAEEMLAAGASPKVIAAYEHYRTMMSRILTDVNLQRAAKGLPAIPEQQGYFPASWRGKYWIEIKKDGNLFAVEASHRAQDLTELAKTLRKEGYEVGDVQTRSEQKALLKNDFEYRPLFDQLAESLGRDSLEKAMLNEIINLHYEAKGFERAGFKKHFEPKAGVEGYRGSSRRLTPLENVEEGLRSVEQYVGDAYDWIETNRTLGDIQGFWTSDYARSNLPNMRAMAEEYWNQAKNNPTNMQVVGRLITDALDTQLEKVPFMRLGSGSIQKFNNEVKAIVMLKMLGGYRPTFLLSSYLQPGQMMGAALLEVMARNPETRYARTVPHAMLQGSIDGVNMLIKNTKGDKFLSEMAEYAHKEGIFSPNVLSDVMHAGDIFSKTHILKEYVLGGKVINKVEQLARAEAYAMAARMLEGTMSNDKVFNAAKTIMDQAMTNYLRHERANVWRMGGPITEAVSPLQTFKLNYLNQMVKYLKLWADNPTSFKNAAPFMAQMGAMLLFGGTMGLLGLKELDALVWALKQMGIMDADSDNVTQWLMKKTANLQGRDYLRYGVWSGLTGANLSPNFAMTQIMPHGFDEVAPIPVQAAGALGDLIGAATSPSSASLGQLAQNLPGGPATGLAEWSRTSPEGVLQNPDRRMEGQVPRNPNTPDPYRMAGSRSIQESERMTGDYQSKQKMQDIADRRNKLQESILKDYMDGKASEKKIQEFIALQGDPKTLARYLLQGFINSKSTSQQRDEMRLRNIQNMQRYLEQQEYQGNAGAAR